MTFCSGHGCDHRFNNFLRLHTLDISLKYSQTTVSVQELEKELCDVLSSVASPVLKVIHFELNVPVIVTLGGLDLHLQDLTVHAKHMAYGDLHRVLTRTIFDELTDATIVLKSRETPEEAKLVENLRYYLRMPFMPWCSRGITRLVSV